MLLFTKVLLMLHFVGLAMGLAVAFANMIMATLIARAAPPEKPILGRFPLAMSKVGYIGLSILWVTGIAMVFTRWDGFGTLPPMFHIKLTVVILLTITVGYIHSLEIKIRKGNTAAITRIQTAGKVSFALALIAIIFAVLTFN